MAKITTDHEEIKKWVEDRGGFPARVKATGSASDPGMLRIEFRSPEEAAALEKIEWDVFFKKFEEKNLALLYEGETKSGKQSRFFKFISRSREAVGAKQ